MKHICTILLVVFIVCGLAFPEQGNAMQPPFISAQCPTGGPEAEQLYQLGVDYHMARKGLPYDPQKAEKFYDEAMQLGNAKAAINLAILYRQDYGNLPNRSGRLTYHAELFQWAADEGCPEGLFALAEAYNNGWGVPLDQRKARSLVQEAAEKGCLSAMVQYGEVLYRDGKEEEGKRWMHKSLDLGNGDAAPELAMLYQLEYNSEGLIDTLRKGAKLGSVRSLFRLGNIYHNGSYGQPKDEEYTKKIINLIESIDDKEYPKPIPDFDECIPLKPILPFKGSEPE